MKRQIFLVHYLTPEGVRQYNQFYERALARAWVLALNAMNCTVLYIEDAWEED